MRKYLIMLVVAVSVAGCASYRNPISTTTLYDIEGGYYTAQQVALIYMRLPLCPTGTSSTLAAPCGKRSIKLTIQATARKAQAAVITLRAFVKNNPTLNSATQIAAALQALTDFQVAISQGQPK